MLNHSLRLTLAIAAFLSLGLGTSSVALGQGGFQYHVEDPLVGSSAADLNLDFWQPFAHPHACNSGGVSVGATGTTLTGQLNYLGYNGPTEVANWRLRGDFELSIFIHSGAGGTRRNHVTVNEALTCTTLGSTYAGLWGGGHARVPGHVDIAPGSSAYYLFVKSAGIITIHQGDAVGVDASDPIINVVVLPNQGQGDYVFYLGVGCPNGNTMLAADFVLDATELVSCPDGTSPPPEWSTGPTDPDDDGDGYPQSVDCDDGDPNIHPGAAEQCNGQDDDCNGSADFVNALGGEGDADGDALLDCADTCPATALNDGDGDGVCDDVDACLGSASSDAAAGVPSRYLKSNRWAADAAGVFVQAAPGNGPLSGAVITMQDTGGCSCADIIAAQNLGAGHTKHGCSNGVMAGWIGN